MQARVRKLVRRYLENHGYTVLEAESGVEALSRAAAHPERIDLLITDVRGCRRSTATNSSSSCTRPRPETAVIYMSGFPDDALSRHGIDAGDITLIQKPFAQQDLLREVRKALGEPRTPESTGEESDVSIPPRNEMH